MERNTQAALGAPGAEGSHVGSGAKKFMFRERHDGDLKQVCEENQEVAVSQGGDRTIEGEQEPEQQQEQPPPDEPAPSPGVGPQPGRRRPRIQYSFTQRQLQELESAFQQKQYPDLQQRRDLARSLYVAESKVQAWFKTRRAKYRKSLREAKLRDAPPGAQGDPEVLTPEQR